MNLKLGLNTSKIKRPKNGSHWLYACFQNDEERSKAIEALNGYSWKGILHSLFIKELHILIICLYQMAGLYHLMDSLSLPNIIKD